MSLARYHLTARAMRNVFLLIGIGALVAGIAGAIGGGVASVAVVSRVSDLIPSLSEVVNKVAVNLEAGNHMMLLGDLSSDKTLYFGRNLRGII